MLPKSIYSYRFPRLVLILKTSASYSFERMSSRLFLPNKGKSFPDHHPQSAWRESGFVLRYSLKSSSPSSSLKILSIIFRKSHSNRHAPTLSLSIMKSILIKTLSLFRPLRREPAFENLDHLRHQFVQGGIDVLLHRFEIIDGSFSFALTSGGLR